MGSYNGGDGIQVLEDQRGERKWETQTKVDPVWYRAMMRKKRLQQRQEEKFEENLAQRNLGKSFEELEQILIDSGEIPSYSSPDSQVSSPGKNQAETPQITEQAEIRKTRLFKNTVDSEDDDMPHKYRHIRKSERMVKDEFYHTCANLCGKGLSLEEASTAVIEVGKGMFGRKNWKKPESTTNLFDVDTAPLKLRILEKMRQIEVQSLQLVCREMERGKEEGKMVTLASDSTTRREVGKFIGMGIHLDQESAFPLPLLSITSETREEVAQQLGMGMQVLSICSRKPVEELASMLDTLISDSVEHNKGVGELFADIFNLDKAPGQLFCGTHTVLGFSNSMDSFVHKIELKMKLETVLAGFMVGMELDSKNGSLSGQALDMILKLVALK